MTLKKNNFAIILSLLGAAIAVLTISILEDNIILVIGYSNFLKVKKRLRKVN